MAIGVKVLKRPEREVSYVRATLKGMALTFKHMFEPKVTMQYPEQKSTTDWSISQRWRGTHRMLTDEQGRSKCVACGLCPQICPANCIKLVPGEDEQGNRYPLIYEIDEFRCVFCGYCQEVCPEEAIHVGRALRELRVQPRALRVRPRAAAGADPPGLDPVGPDRPPGRVDDTARLLFLRDPAILAAVLCILNRNPVASRFVAHVHHVLAGGHLRAAGAELIGILQILVYVGAIMVVFLFVIMLLNLGHTSYDMRGPRHGRRPPS